MKLNPGDRVEMISKLSRIHLGDKGVVKEISPPNNVLVNWEIGISINPSLTILTWAVSADKIKKINNQQLEFNF